MHAPYNHPDLIPFLSAIKRKIKPDKVVCLGDEVDHHAASFHDHDPDLSNHGKELDMAIKVLKQVYKMFPVVDVVDSNHGSLVFRKALSLGISQRVLKPYREQLDAPKGWKWHFDLTVKMSDGNLCYFHHSRGDAMKVSKAMGMSVCQGHSHNDFYAQYWGNPLGLFWASQAACLIDPKAISFAYNKTNLRRPVIGTICIMDGHPKLLPMVLNKKGRWNGKIYL